MLFLLYCLLLCGVSCSASESSLNKDFQTLIDYQEAFCGAKGISCPESILRGVEGNEQLQERVITCAQSVKPLICGDLYELCYDVLKHIQPQSSIKCYEWNTDQFMLSLYAERSQFFQNKSKGFFDIFQDKQREIFQKERRRLAALCGIISKGLVAHPSVADTSGNISYSAEEQFFIGVERINIDPRDDMDCKYLLVTPQQNTSMNGYGSSMTYEDCNPLEPWAKFYDVDYFVTHEQAGSWETIGPDAEKNIRFTLLRDKNNQHIGYLDHKTYEKRLWATIRPFLWKMSNMLEEQKTYFYVEDFGIGNWILENISSEDVESVYEKHVQSVLQVYDEAWNNTLLHYLIDAFHFAWAQKNVMQKYQKMFDKFAENKQLKTIILGNDDWEGRLPDAHSTAVLTTLYISNGDVFPMNAENMHKCILSLIDTTLFAMQHYEINPYVLPSILKELFYTLKIKTHSKTKKNLLPADRCYAAKTGHEVIEDIYSRNNPYNTDFYWQMVDRWYSLHPLVGMVGKIRYTQYHKYGGQTLEMTYSGGQSFEKAERPSFLTEKCPVKGPETVAPLLLPKEVFPVTPLSSQKKFFVTPPNNFTKLTRSMAAFLRHYKSYILCSWFLVIGLATYVLDGK